MVADRTSGGFGGKLRDARERRGISLRQIANATKISVGALEALERNDISRLPGGIFSRAFVRSYATEVGLDPEATIQEFVAEFPNDAATAGTAAAGHVEDHVSVESDRKMAGTFLWLIGLSLPIAGAVLYFAAAGRGGKPQAVPPNVTTPAPEPGPAASPAPEPSAAAPAPAPPAAAAVPPATAPPAARPPAAQASVPPAVPAAVEKLTIVLSVKRPCYVSASIDGERSIERLLQPGERQTIEVQREMVITAGDASAITLTLNGAEAKPLGRTGEVVTARFNLTNYKDYVR
jgi:transcriptional regulator with XRE-family HTH domain